MNIKEVKISSVGPNPISQRINSLSRSLRRKNEKSDISKSLCQTLNSKRSRLVLKNIIDGVLIRVSLWSGCILLSGAEADIEDVVNCLIFCLLMQAIAPMEVVEIFFEMAPVARNIRFLSAK